MPSDIAASAALASFAAPEAAKARDADRVGQALAAARQARAVSEASDNVETTDNDTAVFADAEGAGGQGRAFAETEAEAGQSEAEMRDATGQGGQDGDGLTHLDVEA
jgi:hypothetical protein